MVSIPRRILVPTDFSPVAENARRFALHLARSFAAEVHTLNVQVLVDDPHLDEVTAREVRRLLAEDDAERQQSLHGEEAESAPVPITTHLVRAVSAAEAIVGSCTDLGCDLIVMGTHGRRGLKHFFLGSVAEEVVRTAPAPVVTVRQEVELPRTGLRSILVPHDFSEHCKAALELATSWARRLEAAVTLLHVVEPTVYPDFYAVDLMPHDLMERLRERSQQALQTLVEEKLLGVKGRALVATGRPGATIIDEADPARYDLVIMGTRGLSAIEDLFLGSVAEDVVRRSTVPLMTTRKV